MVYAWGEPQLGAVTTVQEARSAVAAAQAFRGNGNDFVPAPLAHYGPAVAYGGGKYFAVWNDEREGGIYGTRVRQDGTVADPKGLRINLGSTATG